MNTRQAEGLDLDGWVEMRCALWPECSVKDLRAEAEVILRSSDQVCIFAIDPGGHSIGFVEGAIHAGAKGPYAHVEGWYVSPNARGRGYGRALIAALEQWCLHRAIYRLTSDTTPDYPSSPQAHARAGFKTIQHFTIFMKNLRPVAAQDSRKTGRS